ncbi:FlgN protein [Polystyrenella longa]|uniref:FlgN protein n=1 Tax=Polystyrenella longa TaxID=2528007 RepID=A0A518CIS7_9PLAN|nr:hypothetical protein [Polystyrenella longa]QDU79139.1 FlgN protein [Polystyrenella longa]
MAAEIAEKIRAYLTELVNTQTELMTLFRDRGSYLYGDNPQLINQFLQSKTELVQKLSLKLQQREQLLQQASVAGFTANSLQEVVSRFTGIDTSELSKLVDLSMRLTLHLRQEIWKQWVFLQRSHQHYSEVLDLIAFQGKTSPTYHARSNQEASGGAILDASA